jgi:hypothetical protein
LSTLDNGLSSAADMSAVGSALHRVQTHALLSLTRMLTSLQIRSIVKASRSSPQQTEAWLAELAMTLRPASSSLPTETPGQPQQPIERLKRLILDVATRWSSTHQMLGSLSWFWCYNCCSCSPYYRASTSLSHCHRSLRQCLRPSTPSCAQV